MPAISNRELVHKCVCIFFNEIVFTFSMQGLQLPTYLFRSIIACSLF